MLRMRNLRALTLWAGGMLTGVAGMGQRASVSAPPTLTPPMGWNSWDAYGLRITEADFRANATVLKEKLLPFGWRYAVIDEGWFLENPQDRDTPEKLHYALDGHGRYVPVPARFPSAGMQGAATAGKLPATIEETSFVELGKWVHAQGLLFGIHIVRGIPRAAVERNMPIEGSGFRAQDAADESDVCPWDPTNWGVRDTPAGQAWYDALLRQYAAWGVDLLKADCIASHPYKPEEIRMIRRAIDKTKRPMVLSLSPGPTALEHSDEVSKLANMWRISDDFWDVWEPTGKDFPQSLKGQFDREKQWDQVKLGAGQWPDADMLPMGELRPSPGWGEPRSTRFTPDEQRTMLTLWAMARSPLILGSNLTMLDEATVKLLTNRELIAIDQTATGDREISRVGNLVTRRAELPSGKGTRAVVALFNLGDAPVAVDQTVGELGLSDKSTGKLNVTEVWTGRKFGKVTRVSLTLAPHACVLLESR